jgi:protein involved in polysaccharide export with SLBB domain
MKKSFRVQILCSMLGVFVILILGASAVSRAQESSPYDRGTAIQQADSRAEHAAEEMVSLSADKIITLLRQEPGLMLQVKKALVRKAYEQGRILDPADLDDDSLFRLLWEDENVRVIATQEIERRNYVRAKPTQAEIDRRGYSVPVVTAPTQNAQGAAPANRNVAIGGPQEDAYWSTHEDNLYAPPPAQYPESQSPSMYQEPGAYQPSQPRPQYAPTQPVPQNLPANSNRAIERTQLQSPAEDYFGNSQGDSGQMTRIQPDELPALLSASTSQRSLNPPGNGIGSGSSLPGTLMPRAPIGSGFDSQGQYPPQFPQQASLETRPQAQIRSFVPSVPRQPMLSHRPNPYADVPSLYDLYAQYSRRPASLERFGEDIFRNGTGNFDQLPMDLPVGPDYVVGPGDGLSIEMWGGVSERLQRVVDPEGRLALPEVGTVQVAGRNLGAVQSLVQGVLRSQFRDVEADVSLSRLRTIRVWVTGYVERPGAYDVSSLSTPLNAVYTAGGPTSEGSLRILKHYRGNQLLQEVDVYDLLLHGVHGDLQRLESGDVVLVPPLGGEVTVEGMVRRPAVYELNGEKSLAEVLELAGGVLPSGTLRHVDVERLEAHESRTMLRLDIPENNNQEAVNKALEDFKVQDGDKIKISPILPYADKTVYLDGHVFRPGKYAYRDGMKVTDLIKSYNDLLPEPSRSHAEIIRLEAPDYTPEVLTFNLGDALSGKDQDLVLKPFDTVRVFGRYDFQDPPIVTVSGEVRDPGDHLTNGVTHLRDAVYLAGGATPDALLDDAQVFRKTADGKLKVLSVNLAAALAGNDTDNILLEPQDRIFIHRDLSKLDPATVEIQGQVARPGKYPLGEGMTAAELVRVAGGFKRSAYTETADLTSYVVEGGKKIVGDHTTVPIAEAMAGQPDSDVRLHDGDVLTIGALAGWNDVGATIALKGEVVHPGTYGIREGERLSSIIARAGGLREDAYPYGAIFERTQVMELQEKSRSDLIRDIRDQGTTLQQGPENDPAEKMAKEAALQQWQSALEQIQNTPPAGRMVIHISSNMKRWANTISDVQVRAGDSLYVPKKPGTVMVDGSVYNPTAITFKPGKNAGWYLRQAGGPTNMANKKGVFVIRADGSVVGGSGGLFSGGVEHAALQPGDMVVVPEKAFSANTRWKTTLEGAQLAYAVGIAIQVARSF